ncbi:hypothetical protein [Pseudorhodoferax sp.]|uniref:hypothetical protein n=1 Tax=Pseudorhodoferax sp. TaxID=1993553 RepID=UPI0039E5E098
MDTEPTTPQQPPLTPAERLDATRAAIALQLARRRRRPRAAEPQEPARGFLPRVRRAARVWWDSHPVHDAVAVARPALEDYAHARPYRLVGIAAGIGAGLALLRGWRLLPLTGLVLALMKSSDVKATVQSFAAAPGAPGEPLAP